jgi:outer membrane protein insertion porin family
MHSIFNSVALACVVIFLLLHLNSCNYAKHISANETLLWQNRIIYTGNKFDKKLKEDINSQVGAAIVQRKTNTAIFGLDLETLNIGYVMPRRRLLNYNLLYNKITKDSNNFYIKRHIAEKPVVYNESATIKSIKNIKTTLNNQGYFYATVKDSVITKTNKKTSAYFIINPGKNYILNNVNIICNNESIKSLIESTAIESYTKIGEPITLSNISKERNRISQLLISKGYFYMRTEAIIPTLDTVKEVDKKIFTDGFAGAFISMDTNQNKPNTNGNITFTIKDSVGNLPLRKYYYDKIIVYIGKNVMNIKKDSMYKEVIYNNIIFRKMHTIVKEDVLYKNIFLNSGDVFSVSEIEATLNRLNSLQVFRSVKLETIPSADSASQKLDCELYLDIDEKYAYKLEVEGSNSPGNYLGGLNLKYSFLNNNIFKGANLLSLSTHAGVLSNIANKKIELFQTTYGINAELSFPKFLLVQNFAKTNPYYLPLTKISTGIEVYNRPERFKQISLNTDINYKWQVSKKINYKITPLFITYVFTPYKSINPVFYDSINLRTKVQLKNISIIGSNASLEYSNKLPIFQPHYSYAQFTVEKAGYIAEKLYTAIGNTDSAVVKYTRLQGEYRYYINTKKSTWANRLYTQFGIPGKNNTSLPLVKQVTAGGSSSMRGWEFNGVGPGSSNLDTVLFQQFLNKGDIQMELNSEFRFKMFRLFSTIGFDGAIFVDAGNIWQYRSLDGNSSGQFLLHKIGKDIAVNTGYGLRLDFSLFIIRLDWGVKLRKPNVAANNGWNTKYDFRSYSWRKENQSFQIGLSYPF